MVKKDFINAIAEKNDLKKVQAERILEDVFEIIKSQLLEGKEVNIHGFGKFIVKERAQRRARNPKTGDILVIPSHKAIIFKPTVQLKESVR